MAVSNRPQYLKALIIFVLAFCIAFFIMNLHVLISLALGVIISIFGYAMKFWFKQYIESFIRLFLKSK